MAEREREVKTYQVDYLCDECDSGLMQPLGSVLTSSPPQYPHGCTNCGARKTFHHCYPRIVTKGNDA